MARTRQEFRPEFKREAVALLEGSGRPRVQVAAELGIQPSMLGSWRAVINGAVSRPAAAPIASPAAPPAGVARRPRGLARAPGARGILKQAIGIFSGTRDEIPLH